MQAIQKAHEDKIAAYERELKMVRLQQRKNELETSKSPIRGGVTGHSQSIVVNTEAVNDLSQNYANISQQQNQLSHQRPKSSINARSLLQTSNNVHDQSNASLYSARTGNHPTGRSRQTTPSRISTSQTRPGKLDLQKLAELYKEYPTQLERPQLIAIDFFL